MVQGAITISFCAFSAQIRSQRKANPQVVQCTNGLQSNQRSPSISDKLTDQQREVFIIVCDGISDWRDLGRCLNIADVELDRIGADRDISHNIKLITHRILKHAKEQYTDEFPAKLRTALIDARRRDILRKLSFLDGFIPNE